MFFEIEQIDQQLLCPLCVKRFDVPKVLPCGESICELCVQMSIKKAEAAKNNFKPQDITCPLCSKEHRIPSNGFPSNKILKDLLGVKPIKISRGALYDEFEEQMQGLHIQLQNLEELTGGVDLRIKNYCEFVCEDIGIRAESLKNMLDELKEKLLKDVGKFQENSTNILNKERVLVNSTLNDAKNMHSKLELELKKNNLDKNTLAGLIKSTKDLSDEMNKTKLNFSELLQKQTNISFRESAFKLEEKSYGKINYETGETGERSAASCSDPDSVIWNVEGKNRSAYSMMNLHSLRGVNNINCIKHIKNLGNSITILIGLRGDRFATGSWDKSIKIWSSVDFSCIKNIRNAHKTGIDSLVLLNQDQFASASSVNSIKIWSTVNFTCIKHIQNEQTAYQVLYLGILNNDCFVSGSSGTIKIWSSIDFSCIKLIEDAHEDEVRSFTLLNNEYFASGSKDMSIKIWRINNFSCIKHIKKAHAGFVKFLAALSDDLFASASDDFSIKIWRITDFICIKHIEDAHTDTINSLVLLNSDHFASASVDTSIKIWRIADFSCVKHIEDAHTDTVFTLALLNNEHFASGSKDGSIKIWSSD